MSRRKTIEVSEPVTPKRLTSNDTAKTPHHLRSKIKKEISRLAELESGSDKDFSSDESEYEPTSSSSSVEDVDESSSEEENITDSPGPAVETKTDMVLSISKTPRKAANKNSKEYIPESDGYFTSVQHSKLITSDHTLHRLKTPRMPFGQLSKILSSMKLSKPHEQAITSALKEYKTSFYKWICLLNEGYNIILYGLGSKRKLLEQFHKEIISKKPVIVVNGFFPSLTIKNILDSIVFDILDVPSCSGNHHEIIDTIQEELRLAPELHIFLIIHNIDGTMLRNVKAQEILSRLASLQNIHLLASTDHVNTPLLWDHSKLSNYNFLWWDVTTMLPYTEETAFENSLLVQNSGELAISSMQNVFESLTSNSKKIYILIAKNQLSNVGNPQYQGMPFKDLYWACREQFLVSSDIALRAQLTEFLDHKLIKTKRSVDGTELLRIPINTSLLEQFIDQQKV